MKYRNKKTGEVVEAWFIKSICVRPLSKELQCETDKGSFIVFPVEILENVFITLPTYIHRVDNVTGFTARSKEGFERDYEPVEEPEVYLDVLTNFALKNCDSCDWKKETEIRIAKGGIEGAIKAEDKIAELETQLELKNEIIASYEKLVKNLMTDNEFLGKLNRKMYNCVHEHKKEN